MTHQPADGLPPHPSSPSSHSHTRAVREEYPTWDEIVIEVDLEDTPDARTTIPVRAAAIALAFGVDAEAFEEYARSSGRLLSLVGTQDGVAAVELLGVLRPCIAMVGPAVSAADRERLRAAAVASGVHLVLVQPPHRPITLAPPRRIATDVTPSRKRFAALALPPKEAP